MEIQKFTKDKANKYKVLIDNESYTLYDDVIVKYNLISKKEIDRKFLDEVLSYNDELVSYYESIKYINKRLRCEKEIVEFLRKKDIDNKTIKDTIKKLRDNKFINDEIYVKSFITDQINLSNNGPHKIRKQLIKLELDENLINEYLNKVASEEWLDRIEKIVSKKIKLNHSNSAYILKAKLQNELVNLGYDKESIIDVLNHISIDDAEIREKEYNKIRKSLEKKYSGQELEYKIKEKLYRKGFRVGE